LLVVSPHAQLEGYAMVFPDRIGTMASPPAMMGDAGPTILDGPWARGSAANGGAKPIAMSTGVASAAVSRD